MTQKKSEIKKTRRHIDNSTSQVILRCRRQCSRVVYGQCSLNINVLQRYAMRFMFLIYKTRSLRQKRTTAQISYMCVLCVRHYLLDNTFLLINKS